MNINDSSVMAESQRKIENGADLTDNTPSCMRILWASVHLGDGQSQDDMQNW